VLATLAMLAIAQPARANTLKVTITGVDKELADAVRAHLTASQYANRKDVNDTQARVLANDAAQQARTALQPYGYYNAKATAELAHAGDTWQVQLRVEPGPATKVATLDLKVPDVALRLPPVQFAVRAFHPRVGEQLNDATYEASKAAIGSAMLESGYLDAKATERKVAVTRADNRADIHLHYDVGERYKLGAVTFAGSQFMPGFLQRYVPWETGDWYAQSSLLALQQALTDADYFSIVDVEPVVAKAHDHANFNLGIAYRDENTKTSVSRTLSLAANETRNWHGFVRTLGVHALAGTFTVGNSGNNVNIPGVERGRSTLFYGEGSLTKKVADNPLFVRNGYSVNLIARAGPGLDTQFAQALADATWIHALGRRDRLILRGNAGITSVGDFSKLPPQLRFYAGGDRSIRGYAYQAIGPRNSYGLVVGGQRLLVASATVEHYFTRNWGMAAFVDSGDAFDGTDFHAETGAGLGLRWRSPVGMVRVDIGVPINNPYYHGAQLHIVIGPDL
jgi:outer membrane translocation and assembly module TamA